MKAMWPQYASSYKHKQTRVHRRKIDKQFWVNILGGRPDSVLSLRRVIY